MDHRVPHAAKSGEFQADLRSVDSWLAVLAERVPAFSLLSASEDEQQQRGYRHTLREILQQPVTWLETAAGLGPRLALVQRNLDWVLGNGAPGAIILTGSGSSVYAGECLAPALQSRLGLTVRAVAGGEILIDPAAWLAARGSSLVVSFARSGNSPESCGVLDTVLEAAPEVRHLVITCNRQGRLATSYGNDPRVSTLVLDDKTCDRSLVMTSSFTNMVLAGQALGATRSFAAYEKEAMNLAEAAAEILVEHGDALRAVAESDFRSAVFLGTGCRFGSAREGALKMLEMTSGGVPTFPETYLGLRHGPMCAVDDRTLVVCFLARDPVTRAYEMDLIRELSRKRLGVRRVIVGADVPDELRVAGDLVVDTASMAEASDEAAPVLDVLVGQVLAFFRCLSMGLHPDVPSAAGVINRVGEGFVIHGRR
jgi:tagatose-6-phosphate ketose/aldose isomerase